MVQGEDEVGAGGEVFLDFAFEVDGCGYACADDGADTCADASSNHGSGDGGCGGDAADNAGSGFGVGAEDDCAFVVDAEVLGAGEVGDLGVEAVEGAVGEGDGFGA